MNLKGLKFMPIDLSTQKEYKINYNAIFDIINSYSIFNDIVFQNCFTNKWIQLLKNQDNVDLKNEVAKKYSGDFFQHTVIFPNFKVFINFDITSIEMFYKQNLLKFKYHSIQMSRFIFSEDIHWTKNEKLVNGYNEEDYIKSEFPIYIVPIYSFPDLFLVIDGNHRLTFKAKHNINYINEVCFDFYTVANNNFFVTEFDKLFWILKAELFFMYKYKNLYPNINDEDLFSYSFLVNDSKMFNYPITF